MIEDPIEILQWPISKKFREANGLKERMIERERERKRDTRRDSPGLFRNG